jgi:hypothetical protein
MLNVLRSFKHRGAWYVTTAIRKCGEWLTERHLQGRIVSGPFRAVKLSEREIFGGKTAKLLGTYELELHPTWERIRRLEPSVAINVGGAEGYYAVGIAASWGVEKVIVFESTDEGREGIIANGSLNNIDTHLAVHGVCTEQNLAEALKNDAVQLLIMDIEGAELDVLGPKVVRELENCTVIIESHDFCHPGCIDELRARFQRTHTVEIVTSRKRIAIDFPYTSKMPVFLKEWLMDEGRPGAMEWLVGYPRSATTAR